MQVTRDTLLAAPSLTTEHDCRVKGIPMSQSDTNKIINLDKVSVALSLLMLAGEVKSGLFSRVRVECHVSIAERYEVH